MTLRRTRHVLALAITVAAAACGSDPPAFVDAGPVDATTRDAATVSARVTVHVTSQARDGLADPTATVFLTSPDGAIDAQGHPGADGTFTGLGTPGGSVTVGWTGDPVYLETITDLVDGDELWFGRGAAPTELGVMTITVPARAGANGYRVIGPCLDGFSPTTTIRATITTGCAATHPLLVHVQFVGAPTLYLTAPAVTPVPDTTVALTGAWTAATTFPVDVRGVPAGVRVVDVLRFDMLDGMDTTLGGATLQPVDGGGALTFRGPAELGNGARFTAGYGLPDQGNVYVNLYRPTRTEVAPLDLGPGLPAITDVTAAGATATWAVTGAGTFDALVVERIFSLDGKSTDGRWRAVQPPTATRYTFPALPAPFELATAPLSGVSAIEASTVDAAAFRARAGTGRWVDEAPTPPPTDARWILRGAGASSP